MRKLLKFFFIIFILFQIPLISKAQDGNDIFAADDDDLNVGGDIFTDFNEDMENAKVIEDERFYRFGRFFSFNVGAGLTWFDGNRGVAYENLPPSYNLGFTFFKDFQSALNLGIEFSKHSFFLAGPTQGFPNFKDSSGNPAGVGLIEVSLLRAYFGYRHYIDTSNLGTAITYSNPYFLGRLEYWYINNQFVDQSNIPQDSGGGIGLALGFGLEFPIEIKESYWGIECLMHSVNLPDKNTNRYQPSPVGSNGPGYDDLGGNAYSVMVNYIFNW